MYPHGVGWIGKPTVREGICCKQVTKFVVNLRDRDAVQESYTGAGYECYGSNI
jgi:hypothetical protein